MPLSTQNISDIENRNKLVRNALNPTLRNLITNQYEKLETVTNLDNAYKVLFDDINSEISSYEIELPYLSCTTIASLTENHLIEAAKDTIDPFTNPLFYNNSGNYLAKYKTPFLGSVIIGLSSKPMPVTSQCFPTIQNSIYGNIIGFFNSGTRSERATGQQCNSLAGPTFIAVITPKGEVTTSMQSLKDLVNLYKSLLQTYKNIIYTTSESTNRNSESQTAKDNCDLTITAINNWQALPDFIPSSGINGTSNGCSQFSLINFNYYLISFPYILLL